MDRKARHKQHGNSHAAAPGKQAATSVLPPFSGKLRVDKNLKLSHGDFKPQINEFYKNKQLSAIGQLTATPAFPSPHVLAQFANMAYEDYQRVEPLNGWKLLTTASHFGVSNGYFGTAYWHPEHQHVVIAHRGTDVKNVGALVTDLKGVAFNNYVNQMGSASTFASKVVEVLQEIEQEKRVSFELFFTGHSLGGWLAQITTFTTKYLEENDGIFLNRRKAQEHEPLGGGNVEETHGVRESYHPHAVVFDSPGCKDMLSQMADELDVRVKGHSIDLQQLDITSYLSAPNRFNTCNSHLGTVYRIFPDLSDMDCFSKHTPLHNLATHKMDKIVGAFDPETGQALKDDKGERKIREVVDWLISAGLTGGKEYNEFFKWAEHLNEYHPEENVSLFNKVPAGYHPLRYQTKAYDECAKSLSILTQDEREFLERYRWLCHVREFFRPEELFSAMNNAEAQQEAEQKLRNFELGNGSVRCPDASTLQALIPYVRRLVRLFPHVKEDIKAKLSSPQIRGRVYQYETQRYIEKIHQSVLDFNRDALDLREFLTSDKQVWQLRMTDGDTWTGLNKVYRVFRKTCFTGNCFSKAKCTVLKLKRLLTVNRMINLNTLLASMETAHLIMIACETNQPVNDELKDMFTELFNILKQKKTMKIILTTQSEDSTADFLQKIGAKTLGEGLKTTDEQLTWGDLTSTSQSKILEKEVIFQGRRVALNQLTAAESVTHSFPLADLLKETELTIGEESILSVCSGYNEEYYIGRTFHHNIFIRRDILTHKREGKFADLLASDEQEFKQLCQQNPTSNVHWLVKGKSGDLIWQQSQGNLKTLRNYIDSQKPKSYGPSDLDTLLEQARHQRVMLIADKAGMGKTTILTRLSEQIKQKFPAYWLVRIDLNDYTKQLEAQKGKKMHKRRVLEFVSKEVLKLESRLEKELFQKNFEGNETNKVVIMLDGFDEISPSYKETVIDMLQVLKQTSVEQLWVTTRPHLREELEDNLQQLAYTLQPFSEVEQVEFLNKFWLQNSNIVATSQQQLEIYATALIRKLAQSISDKDKEFAGIPLQTRMLAEVFEEDFKSFYLSEKSEPELPQKLDLLGLYGRFIDSKYDIYYREKSKMPAGNVAAKEQRERDFKGIQSEHQQLALQALFTEDEVTCLHTNDQSTFSDEELARIGIAQSNWRGKPQFIHRTFAEYYVAGFLMHHLTKKTKQPTQVQEFLLDKVLLRRDCHVIRAFLDGLLERCKPSKESLKEYGEKLEASTYGLNQTVLRQAATEDNTNVIGFLLDSLKSRQYSKALKNILLATDNRGRTAWHRAAECGNVGALKKIWECADKVTPIVTNSRQLDKERSHTKTLEKLRNSAKETQIYAEELKEQMLLAQDRNGKTAWHLAAENCNEEVLEKIWGWAKGVQENPNELKKKLVLVQSSGGQTVWHLAAEKCSAEILGKLWGWAKEAQLKPSELQEKLLLGQSRDGRTAWHAAAQRNNVEILDKLWGWAKGAQLNPSELQDKLLFGQDLKGRTAWHVAAEGRSAEILDKLWSWANEEHINPDYLKKVLFMRKDRCMASTWGCAILNGSMDVLQKLWGWAEELKLTPNELKSKLFLAIDENGNTAIDPVEYKHRIRSLHRPWVSPNDEDSYTTIDWAAHTGNIELLEKLWGLCKETQINPDELMTTSLLAAWYRAAAGGYLQIFETLWVWAGNVRLNPHELKRKLLLDRNEDGESAWRVAAARGKVQVLEKLWDWAKEEQINPEELKNILFLDEHKDGRFAWHLAAKEGYVEVLDKLWVWAEEVETNANNLRSTMLLAQDKHRETAWHLAVRNGKVTVLEKLLNLGKELQLKRDEVRDKLLLDQEKGGQPAWFLAAGSGNVKVLEELWLLAKEARNPEEVKSKTCSLSCDVTQRTAEISVTLRQKPEIMQINSALVLAQNEYGQTALHVAVDSSVAVMKKLWAFAKEAQLHPDNLKNKLLLAKDKNGNTMWHTAAGGGRLEILEVLWIWAKEAQLKPDELKSKWLLDKGQHGKTVWHAAAERDSLQAIELLRSFIKEAQLKPDELNKVLLDKDDSGMTVWYTAAEGGSLEILEALWSWAKEAQLKQDELCKLILAKDTSGETAWHAAARRGNMEMLEALWSWAKEAQLKPDELSKLLLDKDKHGKTLWHAGPDRGTFEILELLWSWAKEAQLKPDELKKLLLAEDTRRNTVWYTAVEKGNLKILDTLRSWAKEAELKPDEINCYEY